MEKVLEKLKSHAKDTYQKRVFYDIHKFQNGDRTCSVIENVLKAFYNVTDAGRELDTVGIAKNEFMKVVVDFNRMLQNCGD